MERDDLFAAEMKLSQIAKLLDETIDHLRRVGPDMADDREELKQCYRTVRYIKDNRIPQLVAVG